MPRHPPNHVPVRCVYLVQQAIRSVSLCGPEHNLALVMRARKELLLVRVPSDNQNLRSLLALEAVQLVISFALAHIENLNLVALAASQEPVAIYGVPSDLVHGVVVRLKSSGTF